MQSATDAVQDEFSKLAGQLQLPQEVSAAALAVMQVRQVKVQV